MQEGQRGFLVALGIVQLTLCAAAALYAHQKDIPNWVTIAVVPAFLVEALLYLASGLAFTRRWLEQRTSAVARALLMTASACLPYLIYSLGSGVFSPRALGLLLMLSGAASFWYVLWRRVTAADIGFLLLMGGVYLSKVFVQIYPDPIPKLTLSVLGILMWIRLGILAVLSLRGMEGIGFGFVPRPEDWRIGFVNYLCFLPLGWLMAWWLGFIQPGMEPLSSRTAGLALATFAVTLWVLALGEEFFFRGVLQQVLQRKLCREWAAIAMAAVIFGLLHLGFRDFPNWRFALLAATAGLFYGHAYASARSIRASMVTHALVVTTWRVFLS